MAQTAGPTGLREQILNVAAQVLQRRGFNRVTIGKVAREAGLSRVAVFLHFRNKADLTLSAYDYAERQIQERLREIVRSDKPPLERLRDLLQARVMLRHEVAAKQPTPSQSNLPPFAPLLERRRTLYQIEAAIVSDLIIEGRLAQDLSVDHDFYTAQALLDATNAFMPDCLTEAELSRPDELAARLERVIQLLIRALRP